MDNFETIKTMYTNNFLIKGKLGHLLIDTGIGPNYNDFLTKFRRLNVDIKDIKYIVLTHHHTDHTAFLNKIREDTNAKLIIHKKEIEYLEEGINKIGEIRNLMGKILKNKLVSSILKSDIINPVKVNDDDIILEDDNIKLLKEELGINGIIIHTPGHTKGSLSVVLSDGNAFVGDVIMNLLFSSPYPFVIQDKTELFNSWKKLIECDTNTLYPAHGDSIEMIKISAELKKEKNLIDLQAT